MPTTPGRLPPQALIGMVHIHATPGAPGAQRSVRELVRTAQSDAALYAKAGFDGVIIENMHDAPYLHGRQGPQVTAAMTACGLGVQEVLEPARTAKRPLPMGVQILSGGNQEALAVALATGGAFIRCENFVFAHVGDEGVHDRAEAGALLRYRRQIDAAHIAIYCDIQKKHASHALTADLSITDLAEGALFFRADGLIVTGSATGKPTDPEDLAALRALNPGVPILVGSGVTPQSAPQLLRIADGLIVGSYCKRDGDWRNPIDRKRLDKLVASLR